jgi:hypothetical protein
VSLTGVLSSATNVFSGRIQATPYPGLSSGVSPATAPPIHTSRVVINVTFIKYEEHSRWARTADQATLLHDRMMDRFRAYSGLEISIYTRAVERPVPAEDIAYKLYKKDQKDRRDLPIRDWIARKLVQPVDILDDSLVADQPL